MEIYYTVMVIVAAILIMLMLSYGKSEQEGDKHCHHSHKKKIGHKHGEGVFSIDYYAYISKIKKWNPSFKVLFSVLVLVLCIVLNNIYVSSFILITMGYITIVRGGIPLHEYISLMTIPIVFIIMGSITIAIGFSKSPIGEYNLNLYFFYIYTSADALMKMAALMLKAFAAVSAMYMMTLSTPSGEIISVLRKSKIPKLVIELMNMIYRYIFVIMDTQCKMKNSAQSRLGYVDFKTSCVSFSGTASNLLIVSLKKANTYYDALESRCYDGELLFLEEEKKITKKQIIFGIIYIIVLMSIWSVTAGYIKF